MSRLKKRVRRHWRQFQVSMGLSPVEEEIVLVPAPIQDPQPHKVVLGSDGKLTPTQRLKAIHERYFAALKSYQDMDLPEDELEAAQRKCKSVLIAQIQEMQECSH